MAERPHNGLNVGLRVCLALVLVAGMCAFGCAEDTSSTVSRPHTEDEPDQIFIEPHMVVTENGITSAVMEARTVRVFEERNYTSLEDSVRILFFDDSGEHTTTLTADFGNVFGLYTNVDSLSASGNVVIVSIEQDITMETEDIHWNKTTNKVHADGFAVIRSRHGFEQGYGFVANDDLSEYEFRGEVSGEYSEKEIDISGDR